MTIKVRLVLIYKLNNTLNIKVIIPVILLDYVELPDIVAQQCTL